MKRYAELFETAEARAIPLSVLVELTHACNVDCEHCYLDLRSDREIGALSTEEWRRIFRELAAEGCLFLTLSGGELLARRDWFELARYARELHFGLRLYTNGTLIDETIADQMASLAPRAVEISLHGGTDTTHDAITRRRGSFERTLRGVRLLRARNVPVQLKCVLMRRNQAEHAAVRALADELGADLYVDAEVTPKNDGSREPVALGLSVDELRAVAADLWPCAQARHFDREARLADAPCAAGRRTCHIGPTGDVSPCTQWTQSVGNLRTQSFSEIWRGNATLARLRRTTTGDLTGCRECALLEACTPCMALSLLERGNLDGPSPTKCRTATARASAYGIPGSAAGSLASSADLVPLRIRR